jgi:hypothetical protein
MLETSEDYKELFSSLAYKRVQQIKEVLEIGDLSPAIRLLYYKELYSISNELFNSIDLTRKREKKSDETTPLKVYGFFDGSKTLTEKTLNISKNPPVLIEEGITQDLVNIVAFIRNLLYHFPLFEKWDDIWLTQKFATVMNANKPNGAISSFLTDPKFFKQITINSVSKIIHPSIKNENEKIFLKDIIMEKYAAFIVIELIEKVYASELAKRKKS